MNIQSSLNSMIGTVGYSAGLGKYFLNTQKWFGEEPTKSPKPTKAEKQYEKSGQAQADQEAEAMYNEQMASAGETKELASTAERIANIQNTKEGLAQRKEYLRKPRVLNRHGTIYQEVMKDGK